jgi:hypothetical protein
MYKVCNDECVSIFNQLGCFLSVRCVLYVGHRLFEVLVNLVFNCNVAHNGSVKYTS